MLIALYLLGGLILLVLGGEWLVKGAERLALRVGLSRLVIGLTVVAFGTSSPELAVSLVSTFEGQPDLALGNVVGSNSFNVLMILGLAAAICPLTAALAVIRREVPIMIGVSLLALAFAWDLRLERWEGIALFLGLITYLVWAIRSGKAEVDASAEKPEADPRPWLNPVLILAGLGLLVAGSRLFVIGAIQVAEILGLSERVIGLTIVAAGTSLPELFTSVIAAFRKQSDIAVGNIVGSNIFNILGILGLSVSLAPGTVPVASGMLALDMPVMILAAILCLPLMVTAARIDRWEGWFLFALYVAYVIKLIVSPPWLADFGQWVLIGCVPLGLGSYWMALRMRPKVPEPV